MRVANARPGRPSATLAALSSAADDRHNRHDERTKSRSETIFVHANDEHARHVTRSPLTAKPRMLTVLRPKFGKANQ